MASDSAASWFRIHFFEREESALACLFHNRAGLFIKKNGRQSFRSAAALSLGCLKGIAVLLKLFVCPASLRPCPTAIAWSLPVAPD